MTGRAAAPKGTKSCRIQGESVRLVHPYIRPSVRPSPPRPPESGPGLSEAGPGLSEASPDLLEADSGLSEAAPGLSDERSDGWTGHTDSPCILQDFVPFGAAALLTLKAELRYETAGQGYR